MGVIRLQGRPVILPDGKTPAQFRSQKALELLALIATEATGISRPLAAHRLWPEYDSGRALHNLRQNILYLKKAFPDALASDDKSLRLMADHEVDTGELEHSIASGDVTNALRLFQPFMEGFHSEWVEAKREWQQSQFIRLLLARASALQPESPSIAADLAARVTVIDPYLESARRIRFEAMSAAGERGTATHEAGEYVKLLQREMGIKPSRDFMLQTGLEQEQSNLPEETGSLSAEQLLRYKISLTPRYTSSARFRQGIAVITEALKDCNPNQELLARANNALSRLSFEAGDQERALQFVEVSLKCEWLGKEARAEALICLARAKFQSDFDLAERSLRMASKMAREIGSLDLQAECLVLASVLRWYQHRSSEALKIAKRAAALAAMGGAHFTRMIALASVGSAYFKLGKLAESAGAFEKAIAFGKEHGFLLRVAHTTGSLGRVREAQGRMEEAKQTYLRALKVMEGGEGASIYAHVITYLGDISSKQGRWQEALSWHERGAAIRRVSGDRLGYATSLRGKGLALCGLSRFGEAEDALTESMHIYLALTDPLGTSTARIGLAHVHARNGNRARALQFAREAQPGLAKLGTEEISTMFENEIFLPDNVERFIQTLQDDQVAIA